MKSVIALLRYSVIALKGRNLTLSVITGILLSLPFSFGKFWMLAWFAFVPLFLALKDKSRFQAFCLAYLCGFIFWWFTIYWLVHVTLLGTVVLILYLSLYFGIFGLFVTNDQRPTTNDWLFIPSLWVLLEYCRSHLLTGFPWALLGYSQYQNLPIIQIADVTGAWGVSFLVMTGNAVIFSLVVNRYSLFVKNKNKKISLIVPIVLLLVSLGYGFYRLYQRPTTNYQRLIKISVIQANILQELKWEESARGFIIKKYLGLTAIVASATPDLIIWPEAALPVVLEEEPEYYNAVVNNVRQIKTPLLFGAVTQRQGFYYNSACLLSAEGALLQRYDKVHLVPFGEYIPLKKVLPFLETIVPIGDIAGGREYTIFGLQASGFRLQAKFGTLICFEDLFADLSRKFVKDGAEFLVNITNDAWYKKTSAAMQHFQASVFRAVENRVYLVRAANTGISGFIAPSGKVVSLVREPSGNLIFIDGICTQIILLEKHEQTFYGKRGDFFILLFLFFAVYWIIFKFKHV